MGSIRGTNSGGGLLGRNIEVAADAGAQIRRRWRAQKGLDRGFRRIGVRFHDGGGDLSLGVCRLHRHHGADHCHHIHTHLLPNAGDPSGLTVKDELRSQAVAANAAPQSVPRASGPRVRWLRIKDDLARRQRRQAEPRPQIRRIGWRDRAPQRGEGERAPDGTEIRSDRDFANYLLQSADLAVFPDEDCGMSPAIRVSFANPPALAEEAGRRLKRACEALR
jgi:hypothetical protein